MVDQSGFIKQFKMTVTDTFIYATLRKYWSTIFDEYEKGRKQSAGKLATNVYFNDT